MRKVKVEIITPVHNRRDITLQCLKSLARIDTDNLDVHIIIVDDGSSDGTAEAIRAEYPDVEIITGDGNLWYSEGINVGVRAALKYEPDYILAINDDSIFDQDFLQYLVATAEKHPKTAVGALLLLWDQPHRMFQTAPVFKIRWGGWRHWRQQTVWTMPPKEFEVELIVGNCVLFPAEAFREHGLLKSRKYPVFGDAEYTPRLRKKGWKLLINPKARVFCQPNNIPAKIARMTLRQKLDSLFVNLHHTHNLRRRFYAYWEGAPNRRAALMAYGVFFARILVRRNLERDEVFGRADEQPLSEIFAGSVVND